MNENKEYKKSPIKDLPVRMPGQSLRERIDYLIDEDTMPWALGALCATLMTVVAWCVFFFKTPAFPWAFTLITAVMIPVSILKIMRTKGKVKALRLGQT